MWIGLSCDYTNLTLALSRYPSDRERLLSVPWWHYKPWEGREGVCYSITTVALVQSAVIGAWQKAVNLCYWVNESGTKPSVRCAHQPPEADLGLAVLSAGCRGVWLKMPPWSHSLQVTVLWGMLPKNIYLKVLWGGQTQASEPNREKLS